MRTEQAISILKDTNLFSGLEEEALLSLAERCITRRYDRGEFIFHHGETGDSLFVMAEGLVKVFVTSEEGDEMVLATIEPPQTFGELAIIDGGPRTASAKSMQSSTLLALTRATFTELLQEKPSVVQALHESLGTLLRRVLEQASDLVFLDLPGRVAKLLLAAAEQSGERRPDGVLLDLKVSQSNLASMVGGSRPTVNQILKAFETRGYLEIQGRKILIKQPDLLRRRAAL
ncbi:MAG: Crp/Fnr family transcriptional regulator [Actinomycetota bacterium]